MRTQNTIHPDLRLAKELVYDHCGFEFTNYKQNEESEEYAACTFAINGKEVQFRISKTTPTKVGQFVTIWQRNIFGIIEPFGINDPLDFIIISSRHENNVGQFVFPKNLLVTKGIISSGSKEGKRGIRVYPPWDKAINKQAIETQNWQTKYFFYIKEKSTSELDFIKSLFKFADGV